MARVHYEYEDTSGQKVRVFKSVTFESDTVTDMTFQKPTVFEETVAHLTDFAETNYFLGDYYMVVRNESGLAVNPALTAVEQGYQFVGDTIIALRTRELEAAEQSGLLKVRIDSTYDEELVVHDPYLSTANTPHSYNVVQYEYGSLSTNIRVIPPTTPAYFEFTKPASTAESVNSRDEFCFLNMGASSTTVYAKLLSQTATNNMIEFSETQTGQWSTILTHNRNCIWLRGNDGTSYKMLLNAEMSSASSTSIDLTSLIGSLSSAKTSFVASEDCSRIAIDKQIFVLATGGSSYSAAVNDFSTLVYDAADQDLTYLLVANTNKLFKFDSGTSSYQEFHTSLNVLFTASSSLASSTNALLVSVTTASSAIVQVFSDSGSALTSLLDYQENSFTATPTVVYASSLTKVCVHGKNADGAKADAYHVNFASSQVEAMEFPVEDIIDPDNIFIALTDTWVYVRQLLSNLTDSNENEESVHGIQGDIYIVEALAYTISAAEAAAWIWTRIATLADGSVSVLTRVTESSTSLVQIEEKSVLASLLETSVVENSEEGTASFVVDGQVQICSPGCSDCTSGVCANCADGYVLDSDAQICYLCAENCQTCDVNNPDKCSACIPGSYLSGSSCLPCDSQCTTCSGSATSCMDCRPKHYYNGSQCVSCARNCKTCSAAGCTKCRRGFALKPDASGCRSCSIHCSDCDPRDIMTCTKCARGLELSNGKCVPCPDNARRCRNGKVIKCVKGYKVSQNKSSCVLNCELPCLNCADNQPTVCTSCYKGAVLSGSTCALDTSCNTNNNCLNCPSGTGTVLVGANCLNCPAIPKCLQCRQSNAAKCAICEKGYYPTDNGCAACPTGSLTCKSATICTGCVPGYTIVTTSGEGPCLACASPCKTCQATDSACTSCVDGFDHEGWKCKNQKNVAFVLVFQASDTATILAIIDDIVASLLQILSYGSDEVDKIIFSSIALGSVVTSGSVVDNSATSSSTVSAASAISSSLSSGTTIGGTALTSSSVTTNGVTTSSDESSSSNMGLIIGIAVGVPILSTLRVI